MTQLKDNLDDFTRDEMYAILIEELPFLRKIAEELEKGMKGLDSYAYSQHNNVTRKMIFDKLQPLLKNWQDCLGGQLDAING